MPLLNDFDRRAFDKGCWRRRIPTGVNPCRGEPVGHSGQCEEHLEEMRNPGPRPVPWVVEDAAPPA